MTLSRRAQNYDLSRQLERLDLRLVEQVVEIARAGGFSGAARRLKISQPSLSKSIARLEAELGVRLFDRDGTGARPTRHGELLAARGARLLEQAADLWREFSSLSEESGRLRIGVGPATRVKPFPQLVKALQRRYPDLQIETRQDEAANLLKGVEDGRFDLVLAYSEGAEGHEDLLRIKIFEDKQLVVASPDHPAARASGRLPVSALMAFSWASWGMTPSFRTWAGDLTSSQMRRATAFTSDDFDMIKDLAVSAGFLARGPRFLFLDALQAGALVEVKTSYVSIYECWMLTTPKMWRSPLIKAVAALAKSDD